GGWWRGFAPRPSAPRSGSTPAATICIAMGSRIDPQPSPAASLDPRGLAIAKVVCRPTRLKDPAEDDGGIRGASYRCPPNSRSISQPSSPAAASGRTGAPRTSLAPGPAWIGAGGGGAVIWAAICASVEPAPYCELGRLADRKSTR